MIRFCPLPIGDWCSGPQRAATVPRSQPFCAAPCLVALFLAVFLTPRLIAADTEAEALKSRAYQLSEQKRYEQAAEAFQRYLERVPGDTRTGLDYAALLSQLNRHDTAAKLLEEIHQKNPRNEAAYFKLGVEYVSLRRFADAERVFTELEKSTNRDLATAAADANRRLRADAAPQPPVQGEERGFYLLKQ